MKPPRPLKGRGLLLVLTLFLSAFGTHMNADSSNAIRAFMSNKADGLHQVQLERKKIKESTQG